MLTTPAMLVRTTLYALLVQALVIGVVASAVPGGAAWMTRAGFVTPHYDNNLFAGKVAPVPWTDPTVYVSVQTLVQMLAVALGVAALVTLARTNPWQHGALPDSLPPSKDDAGRSSKKTAGPLAPAPAPAPAPSPGPAAGPPQAPPP